MNDHTNPILAIHKTANKLLKQKVGQLQILPDLAIKLICLIDNRNTSFSDLANLISSEPALDAKVLSHIKSYSFSPYQEIQSIKQAIKLLGYATVKQIALNQLIYNKLIFHKENFQFGQLFFWQHCLYVATLGRSIAVHLDHDNPDLIYSAGLLHDIGKLILETYSDRRYSDFIQNCKQNNIQATIKTEYDFFGLNHTEMGFIYSQKWHLPDPISACIYYHHNLPDDASPFAKNNQDIATISLADYIAYIQGMGSTYAEQQLDLQPEVIKLLKIDNGSLKRILNAVDHEMQNTSAFYDLQFPNLYKIRSSLVKSSLLSCLRHKKHSYNSLTKSLTIPHQSLDPDRIVPETLLAIQQDFRFERLIMLNINSKQRSLETSYSWPTTLKDSSLQHYNIKMDILPDSLLKNLRQRQPVIINNRHPENKILLEPFKVDEFLLFPVISDNRLIALLYADNYQSHKTIDPECLNYIAPIIHQLGIAMANANAYIQVKNRSELDPLTGLANCRMFSQFLNNCFNLNIRQLNQIAVGFIDIDYFKNFNDTCGHQVGDEALIMVAQIMRSLTRPNDFIGRYGGDEFVFVLQSTNPQGVTSYAERIRQEVGQQSKILNKQFHGHRITISIGVSLFHQEFNTPEKIITSADNAMYKAKQKGRNCVVIV